jgi:hypothetical protein
MVQNSSYVEIAIGVVSEGLDVARRLLGIMFEKNGREIAIAGVVKATVDEGCWGKSDTSVINVAGRRYPGDLNQTGHGRSKRQRPRSARGRPVLAHQVARARPASEKRSSTVTFKQPFVEPRLGRRLLRCYATAIFLGFGTDFGKRVVFRRILADIPVFGRPHSSSSPSRSDGGSRGGRGCELSRIDRFGAWARTASIRSIP